MKNIITNIFLILFCAFLSNCSFPEVTNIHSQHKYEKTPMDAEGPFYPVTRKSDEDSDLINVKGKSKSAKGEVLNLTGVVVNKDGIPHKNVIVEIWQTDANGLYEHPKDRSKGKRDPFFQYWGRAKTNQEGEYSFKTLIPEKYEPRPSHIHFKIWAGKKVVLTSQMYVLKNKIHPSSINELLKLEVTKNKEEEYSGFFRIVY